MIDTSSWKSFKIGDLFIVSRGQRHVVGNHKDGNLPYYSASLDNNGVTDYISNPLFVDNDALVVTTFGDAFYAKDDFTASDEITILHHEKMNELSGLFIASAIRQNKWKYSFKVKAFKERVSNDSISLPVTSDGQPDWDYMESYMRAVMEESEKSLENLRKADDAKHLIDVSGWGEFRVGDLFDKLTLKCLKKDFNKAIDCSEEQTDEFSLPLTNAKHFNNGIQFYGRPDDWESAEMTIDIVSNGAIATGDVYAQPQRTGVLWDSYLVKCKYDITSELVLQYMSCVIQRCVKQYFGWDDKCTWDKVKEQMIRLPITSTGEPDWQYMEDYMRIIMDKSEQNISDLQIGV